MKHSGSACFRAAEAPRRRPAPFFPPFFSFFIENRRVCAILFCNTGKNRTALCRPGRPPRGAEAARPFPGEGCALVAKTVAIVNQKGGVGKTTTCVNLAAALREKGRRVLLCDFDPQANSTSGMGVDKNTAVGVYDVLINGTPAEKAVTATRYGDVLPSSKALAGAGIEMIGLEGREFLLKRALAPLSERYDFIFIDCPPSLELLTLNGLCAADTLLVPVQGEYFALEGLSDLMNTVRIVRRSLNPALQLEGVLLTMFDSRTNLAIQVAEEVKRYFPGKVYATVIPRNVRLSEAPSHGKPITGYDRASRGAEAYLALADEFLRANP